ncbi:MAG: ribulose-phosphate 3-epimerase [Candidatus Omnitrophica bacterium]|nr:ribulose-phosphate 3-epimerase [Candidatus Omnitrophota bacterium]
MIKIAPSVLAADFSCLGRDIKKAEEAGADMIHLDIMDGHFVPNLTIGPAVVQSIRPITELFLDVHLMIEDPLKYAPAFLDAGADGITFHLEVDPPVKEIISLIKDRGKKAGLSINPPTSLDLLKKVLKDDDIKKTIDMILLMTVNPGFGGQSFMPEVLPKIEELKTIFHGDIQVDGGIDRNTVKEVIRAGANVIVAGTSVFKAPDIEKAIAEFKAKIL